MTTTSTPTQTLPESSTMAPVRTLGIVSLSLGVASLVFGANPVLGVAALVVGILGLGREPAGRSFSIAGVVTGGISLLGIALGLVGFLAFLPFAGFILPAFL